MLYLECGMGCAGDMLTAALYELLEDKAGFLETMNGLGLPGVRVEARRASTCGIVGTRLSVTVHGHEEESVDVGHVHAAGGEDPVCGDGRRHGGEHAHEHEHGVEHGHCHGRHSHGHSHAVLADIRGRIAALDLPQGVRTRAERVYDRLAGAEAQVHGCLVEQIHFHEVGDLDAVADVVGACYALYLLRPDRVMASPVHVGSGAVRCAHGVVPVPAPATAVLLEGIPCYGGCVQGELCTPTGAALLAEFASSFGPMPPMAVQKTGYGVGNKQFEQANCVRAFWGEGAERSVPGGEITELVCNLDDMTPEALSHACARLLEEGALDVYTLPGTMKKGRSGWVLTVLCDPAREDTLAQAVLRHTSTNGLRVRRCGKYMLSPRVDTVETCWGPVRVKRAEGAGLSHAKPEYDDVSALARANALPFEAVWREVLSKLQKT